MATIMDNVELVLWSAAGDDPPTVEETKDALAMAGLSASYAEPIPPTTAFRRACDGLRTKNVLVRPFKKGTDLHAQFDKEVVEGDKLSRAFVGVYRCHATLVVKGVGYDFDYDVEAKLQEAFEHDRLTYEWGDLSGVIQNAIAKQGLGSYSPRRGGAIYFMPTNPVNPDLLDKLERFCQIVGIRFLRYAVPDTATQRAEIMESVAAGIGQDVTTHTEAVADYTSEVASGVLDKRVAAINATMELLGNLRHLLNGHYDDLCARLARALAVIEDVRRQATAAHRPVGRKMTFA